MRDNIDELSIEISEDEIRVGEYYLKGRIPDKLAWMIVAAVAAAVGLGHEELVAVLGFL